jgi:hypothetical protein
MFMLKKSVAESQALNNGLSHLFSPGKPWVQATADEATP